MMDVETVNSVEQSHFIRAFRAVSQREKELLKLSPAIRKLIGEISQDKGGMYIEQAENSRDDL